MSDTVEVRTGIGAFLHPDGVLLTGMEPDPEEADMDRVYVGPRYNWRYVLVKRGTFHLSEGHCAAVLPKNTPVYVDEAGRDAARGLS